MVRELDKIDYSFIYKHVNHLYSDEGRPSIDPIILFKIFMIKEIFKIKSIRQTMKEIEVNLAFRWFLQIPLLEKVPHYSVISTNYFRRFKNNLIFENVLKQLFQEAIDKKIINEKDINFKKSHLKINVNSRTNKKNISIDEKSLYEKPLV